jgi:hypothetical protein
LDLTPNDTQVRVAIHAGVVVLSGLVLTSATFVCALTYQSANILMTGMRQRYSRELKRNWVAIIMGAFWTAVLPLFALALDGAAHATALAISASALALLCMRAARCAMWLSISLFMQEATEFASRTVEVPPARHSEVTTVG